MGAQKADAFLLKIGNDLSPETFTAIGGLKTKSLQINSETVDVTTADNTDKWRELLEGAGIKNMSVSGSGIFKDDAAIGTVNTAALDASHLDWQIVVPGLGSFEGRFQVTSMSYAGEHNGEVTYDVSLESAGPIAFTSS